MKSLILCYIFEYLINDYNTNSGGKMIFHTSCRSQNHGTLFSGWRSKQCHCYDQVQDPDIIDEFRLARPNARFILRIFRKVLKLVATEFNLERSRPSIPNIVKEIPSEPYHKDKNGRCSSLITLSNPPFKWISGLCGRFGQ
jgi:hypothetical protein